jgi:hypothetical protein
MAELVGAFIGVWILSRILMKTAFRRWKGYRLLVATYPTTLALVVVLGGLGGADGGAPQFVRALFLYGLPVCAWAAIDGVRFARMAERNASP